MKLEYRAWLTEDGKMVGVSSVSEDAMTGETIITSSEDSMYDGVVMTNDIVHREDDNCRFVLMKDTGIKDSDGKDIYIGDIVVLRDTIEGQNRFIVVQDTLGLELAFENDPTHKHIMDVLSALKLNMDTMMADAEVVGNIYENPVRKEQECPW